jgi:hypothetical protein
MQEVSKMDFDVVSEGDGVCRIFKGPEDRVGVCVRTSDIILSDAVIEDLTEVAAWAWNSALKGAGLQ